MTRVLYRLFRCALLLYPAAFRSRFGAAMTQAFVDRLIAHRAEHHRVAVWFFGARAIANTAANGLAERWSAPRHRQTGDRTGSGNGFGTIVQDVAYAWRVIRRRPALSATAVLTLAIGTGASTAIFSLVDAALLRPLPFDRPAELVNVSQTFNGAPTQVSLANLLDWKRESRTLAAITPMQAQSVNLTGVAEPDRLRGGFVTSDFFEITRVAPAIGRPFTAADDVRGAPAVGVLDHGAWQARFGGDRGILGRTITLNNTPVTIVGIMPERFRFPFDQIEVWLPVWQFTGGVERGDRSLVAVGRLGPGVPLGHAQAELSAIAAQLAETFPDQNKGRGVQIQPFQRWLTSGIGFPLGLVFGLVLLLLVVAASNVTSLQLGASLERRAELGVRVALGASRIRLARQLLVEHGVLALIGGAGGAGIAAVLVPRAVSAAPLQIFGLDRVQVDWRVLLFAFGVTVIAGLASGIVPALHWTARDAAGRASARVIADRRIARLRSGLVVAQVALAAVLLVASGLIVRSYDSLLHVDAGFDADRVLTLEYRLPRNKYATPAAQTAFHDDVVRQVSGVPGVEAAAVARALPFSGNAGTVGALTDPAAPDSSAQVTGMNTVSEGYFAAMRIPLIAGRVFGEADQATSSPVVVVSRTFAEQAWPGESAIGREVRFAGLPIKAHVIGVVGDVRHSSLDDGNVRAIYASNRQNPGIFMTLLARTSGDPLALSKAVRRAIWAIDADQPMWKVRTLGSLVDRSLDLERFLIGVLGLFGISALVLAGVGLSGVVAQSVGQRTREIGVRLALGATPSAAARLIVASGLSVTGIGLALGLPLALLVSRLMGSVLRGDGSTSVAIWLVVALVLGLTSFAACVVPARRAAAIDPARTLRS